MPLSETSTPESVTLALAIEWRELWTTVRSTQYCKGAGRRIDLQDTEYGVPSHQWLYTVAMMGWPPLCTEYHAP
jgi:hypothetical protein